MRKLFLVLGVLLALAMGCKSKNTAKDPHDLSGSGSMAGDRYGGQTSTTGTGGSVYGGSWYGNQVH